MIGFNKNNNQEEIQLQNVPNESVENPTKAEALSVLEKVTPKEEVVTSSAPCVEGDTVNLETKQLTNILGKSTETLKKEFYEFQLLEVSKKLGGVLDKNFENTLMLEEYLASCVRQNVFEIIVSPAELLICKAIQKRKGYSRLKFLTLADSLCGEGDLRGRIATVKSICKNKTDYTVCPFFSRAYSFASLGEYKRKMFRTVRASSKPKFVALYNLESGVVKKIAKALEGLRKEGYLLVYDKLEISSLALTVQALKETRNVKKIYLLCNVNNAKDYIDITKLQIDKVFSKFSVNVFHELASKLKVD